MAINVDSIEKFIEHVRKASLSRSKHITMTFEEAQEVTISLSALLMRHMNLTEEYNKLKEQGPKAVSVHMDGGNFKNE